MKVKNLKYFRDDKHELEKIKRINKERIFLCSIKQTSL
jgi:hypothetical protein